MKKGLLLSWSKIGGSKPWWHCTPLVPTALFLIYRLKIAQVYFVFLKIRCDFNNQLVLNYNGAVTHPFGMAFHRFGNPTLVLETYLPI